jgi:hypothetical protein
LGVEVVEDLEDTLRASVLIQIIVDEREPHDED